ncbi:Hsp20/alpha crystallin family protein [Oceanobacillus halotolerans]|uniref:Hsp20/alpha crystallin family protein n=1 Tax=Oceanobacillus halotolerans TaxID=2663380 RepID=UPI0013DC1BC4|nr:Hsp20/alpha crystallin family protein [Oceanobacillus halotolerans]
MNKYWPNNWKKSLPNFLGEDFWSTFEDLDLENAEVETSQTNNNSNSNNSSGIKVNICEAGNELLCIFRLPGLVLEDVEVDVYDLTLEVVGTIQIDHKGFRPMHMELYQGPVRRKVKLPYPARHDKINATYQHGYLYLHLHRLIPSGETKQKLQVKTDDDET